MCQDSIDCRIGGSMIDHCAGRVDSAESACRPRSRGGATRQGVRRMSPRLLAVLIAALASSSLIADEPAIPVAELRTAIEQSLPLLEKGAIGHRKNREC